MRVHTLIFAALIGWVAAGCSIAPKTYEFTPNYSMLGEPGVEREVVTRRQCSFVFLFEFDLGDLSYAEMFEKLPANTPTRKLTHVVIDWHYKWLLVGYERCMVAYGHYAHRSDTRASEASPNARAAEQAEQDQTRAQ